MLWLPVIISAYFIFAVCALLDKYLLSGPIPSPKVYTFYVGSLGVLVLFLTPFVGFYIPEKEQIFLSLLAGAVFIYAIFWLFKSLRCFETSRIVPAIGGLSPLFTFLLVFLFSFGQEVLSFYEIIAFILLVLGSVLITFKKESLVTLAALKYSALTAFLFSFSFVLTKYVYLSQSFWNGYIWIRIGGFLSVFSFLLLSKEFKKEMFKKGPTKSLLPRIFSKVTGIFIFDNALASLAAILQQWAIFLAPLSYVAIISALQGVQYVFLLILTVLFSFKLPGILKEEISQKVILQKIAAILLIGGGLVILALPF